MNRLLLISICALLGFASCTNSQKQAPTTETDTIEVVDIDAVETINDNSEKAESSKEISESAKQKACSELKSWGAKDAYFDGNYLCYVVSESEISTSAYEVGKAMYTMFEDVDGLQGIKVVSAETKKVLATYPE